MTGVSIRVAVDGSEESLRVLRDIARRADEPRGLWDAIGASLVASTQDRFERGESPDGNPWPASIRVLLAGGQTLINTQRLMKSVTHIADDQGVSVGTNAIYAAVHQLGAVIVPVNAARLHFSIGGRHLSVKKVTIPARPFLGIDEDDETEIINIARSWLSGATPEAFDAR
jgi:phage virion morphogenesis protein